VYRHPEIVDVMDEDEDSADRPTLPLQQRQAVNGV
jgi:hypothetical protein